MSCPNSDQALVRSRHTEAVTSSPLRAKTLSETFSFLSSYSKGRPSDQQLSPCSMVCARKSSTMARSKAREADSVRGGNAIREALQSSIDGAAHAEMESLVDAAFNNTSAPGAPGPISAASAGPTLPPTTPCRRGGLATAAIESDNQVHKRPSQEISPLPEGQQRNDPRQALSCRAIAQSRSTNTTGLLPQLQQVVPTVTTPTSTRVLPTAALMDRRARSKARPPHTRALQRLCRR